MDIEPYGCCTSCSRRPVAVYAATATVPKVLTTLCRAVVEMAIMLHCRASGIPSRTALFVIFQSKRMCSRSIRKYSFVFTAYVSEPSPARSCASIVASAAPKTPSPKTPTKRRSIPTFKRLEMIRKYSGVRESPSALCMEAA